MCRLMRSMDMIVIAVVTTIIKRDEKKPRLADGSRG